MLMIVHLFQFPGVIGALRKNLTSDEDYMENLTGDGKLMTEPFAGF